MCEICLTFPCLAGCPNYEPKVACKCKNCGEEILEGEYVYEIMGDHWCASCIEDCKKEAEI